MESVDKELHNNIKQLAIDSAKKRVAIDLAKETKYLKRQLGVKEIGVPVFWRGIKDNIKYENINFEISCPMNQLYEIKLPETKHWDLTPFGDFFIKHPLKQNRRTSRKVEKLIEDYSNDLFIDRVVDDNEIHLVLRDDFDQLIDRIRTTYISKGYVGIISWLIDRAFLITPQVKGKIDILPRNTNKNKSLLLKTLYETSPQSFLYCFKKST